MNRTVMLITALGLACQLAVAAPPGGARSGRPPVDEIAAKLGLDDYQKTEMQRIFDAAHERLRSAHDANKAQVDTELAAVLTAEQLASLKKLMNDDRPRRGPPPGPLPSED